MQLDLDTGKIIQENKPYVDRPRLKGSFVRTFKASIHPEELTWHKDSQNRLVIVMKGENWKLQFDNELPVILEIGNVYTIKKEVYHRLIKGNGELMLYIIP